MSYDDPCFSLTEALRVAVGACGPAPTMHDLHAALGLPLLMTASPAGDDPAHWPLLARNVFLIPAGRCFGLTIREIHPPEAAVGLDRAAEFAQHFEASYAPLIRRALEHGQQVLAWQGWEGEGRLLWGMITHVDPRGMGFAGMTFPAGVAVEDGAGQHVLARPPVQVYVVEEAGRAWLDTPRRRVLFLRHAMQSLDPNLGRRFGVLTGGPAYRLWAEHLPRPSSEVHERLCRSLLRSQECFQASLIALADGAPAERAMAEGVVGYARALHGALSEVHEHLRSASYAPENKGPIVAKVLRVAALTEQAFAGLSRMTAPVPATR